MLVSKTVCLGLHLRLLAGCSLQGHGGGHHGVSHLPQGRGRLPLGGAGGDVPVVGARRVPDPHPPRRQVRVCLESIGVPERLWKKGMEQHSQGTMFTNNHWQCRKREIDKNMTECKILTSHEYWGYVSVEHCFTTTAAQWFSSCFYLCWHAFIFMSSVFLFATFIAYVWHSYILIHIYCSVVYSELHTAHLSVTLVCVALCTRTIKIMTQGEQQSLLCLCFYCYSFDISAEDHILLKSHSTDMTQLLLSIPGLKYKKNKCQPGRLESIFSTYSYSVFRALI